MKRLLLSLSVLSLLSPFCGTEQSANTLSAQGISNHPDSIWVRLRNDAPQKGAYVEYSNDGVVWLPVGEGQTVFSSDFGEILLRIPGEPESDAGSHDREQ